MTLVLGPHIGVNIGGNFSQVQPNINFEICNPASAQTFGEIRVNINPYPIQVVSGRQVQVSLSVMLNKALEPGTKVAVTLVKKNVFILGDVTVPCMDVSLILFTTRVDYFFCTYLFG